MIDYTTAGTYASLSFSQRSINRLRRWASKNLNPDIALYDYHITICYSAKPIPYQALGSLPPLPIKPVKFSLFGKDKDYLVLEVESAFARNREAYGKILGAISDFPEYSPHVSLAKGFKGSLKDLEPFTDTLYVKSEETTPLDTKYGSGSSFIPPDIIKQIIDDYRKLGISANLKTTSTSSK